MFRDRRLLALIASLVIAFTVSACGPWNNGSPDGGDGGPGCPNDLPGDCVQPSPTYADQVEQILQQRCLPCHQAQNSPSGFSLATYQDVHQLRAAVLTQVYGCHMPPPDAGQLSGDERSTILHWLVCQAPEN